MGLCSFYRKFVPSFARIAQPLHSLTGKNACFVWSEDCQHALDILKQKLITTPVLAYLNLKSEFILETDASCLGLGAIFSQRQMGGKLHHVSYAGRALSPAENNHGITDLEMLAVVWTVIHFQYFLYNQYIRVFRPLPKTFVHHLACFPEMFGFRMINKRG